MKSMISPVAPAYLNKSVPFSVVGALSYAGISSLLLEITLFFGISANSRSPLQISNFILVLPRAESCSVSWALIM